VPVVTPARPRSRVEESPTQLRATIPAARSAFNLFFSVMILTMGLGLASTGWSLFTFAVRRSRWDDLPFVLLGLLIPALGLLLLLWTLFGRETITLKRGWLVVRFEIFGLGRSREYDGGHVKDLRLALAPEAQGGPVGFMPGFGMGAIAFDYGSRVVRFGMIERPEAVSLLKRFRDSGFLAEAFTSATVEPAAESASVEPRHRAERQTVD
jgi:hypothetical protein